MTDTVSTQTTADRSPRKPQDRLPKKSEIMAAEQAPPVGADLMRPVSTLRSGEIAGAQADILELFAEVGIDLENPGEVEVETSPAVMRAFGRLGALLEGHSTDPDAFAELDRGPGSSQRMAELAMWYMGELGKSDSSAS